MLQKLFPLIISVSLLLIPCIAAISFQPFAVTDAMQPEVSTEVLRDDVEQLTFAEAPLQSTDSTANFVPADDTENKREVIAPVFYHSTIYDSNGEPENQFTVQAGSEGIDEGTIITTITYINDIEIGKVNFTVAKRIPPFAKVAHNLSVGIPENLTKPSDKVTASVYLNGVKLGLGENKDNTVEVFDLENIKTLNFTIPISEALLETLNTEQTTSSISSDDISTQISILYDNAYHEQILMPGKQLTAELTAKNSSGEDKAVTLLIALYDMMGKTIITKSSSETLVNGLDSKFNTSIVVPIDSEVSSAKIMLWEDLQSLQPISDTIMLTLENNDYFGNDYSSAQPLTTFSEAKGQISPITDVDVFSYTPAKDGLYIFESHGNTDVHAKLYTTGNYTVPINSDDNNGSGNNFRLSSTLIAGQTYYLYVHGNETGDYAVRVLYAIGNIFGSVSPVKYIDYEPEFNEAIECKVTLTTYDTNEFVAAMHLKEWSVSTSEYAAFDMTGIHGGTYLVSFTRPGYLTRYRKIVLNDNVIDLGSVTLLAGDVNGDGIINAADSALLQLLYDREYGDEGYNIAADLNGDQIINSSDLALLTPNLGKTANIYGENVNAITVSPSLSGSTLTISGTADASSAVTVNVYQGSVGIFNECIAVNSDGTYAATCNLSKAGTYTVVVTANNRAIDATVSVNY
jgi:hypothetical protein